MKKNAFSIAEAFIMLTVVSVGLAAAAPMITKQIKHNNFSTVQANMLGRQINNVQSQASVDRVQVRQELDAFNVAFEEVQSKVKNLVPPGAVMAFNLSECPKGWVALVTEIENSEGAFIRNIGGNAGNLGAVQLDAAPNITGTHGGHGGYHGWGRASGSFVKTGKVNGRGSADKSAANHEQIDFDASKSSASYGRDNTTEVRPKNVALLYCVKK